MEVATQQFDEWAILELFGHQRLAGKVTAVNLGGASFVRVDVPAREGAQGITKYLNPSAIYSITPVSEKTAKMAASAMEIEPINRWDVQEMVRAAKKQLCGAEIDDDIPI